MSSNIQGILESTGGLHQPSIGGGQHPLPSGAPCGFLPWQGSILVCVTLLFVKPSYLKKKQDMKNIPMIYLKKEKRGDHQ